jgi:hypothetical protein
LPAPQPAATEAAAPGAALKNYGAGAGMNEPKLSPRRLTARGDHTRDPAEGLPMLSVFPTELLWMAAGFIMLMAGFLASSASE